MVPVAELPKKRFEHPANRSNSPEASQGNFESDEKVGQRHRKRISILMKAPREQAVVEFPIDSERSNDRRNKPLLGKEKARAQQVTIHR